MIVYRTAAAVPISNGIRQTVGDGAALKIECTFIADAAAVGGAAAFYHAACAGIFNRERIAAEHLDYVAIGHQTGQIPVQRIATEVQCYILATIDLDIIAGLDVAAKHDIRLVGGDGGI